jgi:GDP/UDP-N,N'-diacetylbacillosamine 2-epimerase (hydrolysing)
MNATPLIHYVTGTRADFGLMRRALLAVQNSGSWRVALAATGMHFDPQFGLTINELRSSGLPIAVEVPSVQGARSPISSTQAIADGMLGFANAWAVSRPDAVMLLGDRGEMLAAAIAAAQLGLPIIHLHGGERSGTLDEPTRHAISKFATLHWVATKESAQRLLRMGEEERRITVVGAPGLDGLQEAAAAGEAQLTLILHERWQQSLSSAQFALALLHPEDADAQASASQTQMLAQTLTSLNCPVLWLRPNADSGSAGIQAELMALSELQASQFHIVTHLPRNVFCAAMKHAGLMLGNSSSGIIEAAGFGTPVVNVGDRQRLRQRSANVIDVDWNLPAITEAAKSAMRSRATQIASIENVYGDGQSSARIVTALANWWSHRLEFSVEKRNAY